MGQSCAGRTMFTNYLPGQRSCAGQKHRRALAGAVAETLETRRMLAFSVLNDFGKLSVSAQYSQHGESTTISVNGNTVIVDGESFSDIVSVSIIGSSYDDSISISGNSNNFQHRIFIDAGDGNDSIDTSGYADGIAAFGGHGIDVINGGSGNDLL